MKKAIVYYSMSGNTENIAKKISEKVDVDLIKLVPKKEYPNKGLRKYLWGGKSAVMGETPLLEDYQFDASKYDHIIIGTPVWASSFTPPIRTFIKDNKEGLKGKKISVFITYMGGGADKALNKLKEFLEIDEFKSELVLMDSSKEKDMMIDYFCKKLKLDL